MRLTDEKKDKKQKAKIYDFLDIYVQKIGNKITNVTNKPLREYSRKEFAFKILILYSLSEILKFTDQEALIFMAKCFVIISSFSKISISFLSSDFI